MRAFVAVDASSSSIGKLQSEIMSEAGWTLRDVKPVDTSNFHFTLIFLGEVQDSIIDGIKSKLDELQFEPFTVTYSGVRAFPKPVAARVVWVGVDPAGSRSLVALANDVNAKLSDLGFQTDKPFSPHLTIFRAKNRPLRISDIAAKYRDATFGTDLIDRVHLKKSDLRPSGPIYSNVYTIQAKK